MENSNIVVSAHEITCIQSLVCQAFRALYIGLECGENNLSRYLLLIVNYQ